MRAERYVLGHRPATVPGRRGPRRASRPEPTQTSSVVEERRATSVSDRDAKIGCQLGCQRALVGVELPLREVGPLQELAETHEEDGLERRDGQMAVVRREIGAVARQPTGELARHRVAAEAMRDQLV